MLADRAGLCEARIVIVLVAGRARSADDGVTMQSFKRTANSVAQIEGSERLDTVRIAL